MFYQFALPLPANTAKADEINLECVLSYGKIRKIDVQFPTGCGGFAHLAIDRFGRQLLPTNTGSYFVSDGELISSDEDIDIMDRPYSIYLRGYNTDDTYSHTIYVRVFLHLELEGVMVQAAEKLSQQLITQLQE